MSDLLLRQATLALNKACARALKKYKWVRDSGPSESRLAAAWEDHQRAFTSAYNKFLKTTEGR